MSKQSDRDTEQDELIRRNAEAIQRNEDAIRRQTEALEKIRDHYFPQKSLWKSSVKFILQVIGVLTLYASIMEAGEWFWNSRKAEDMAETSVDVAKNLLLNENDVAGATRFLEKAVEMDGGTVRYRIALDYVKGLSAITDLFDLGRPFTADERERVDDILAEAVYLQAVAPDDPMPHVLAAQARRLRGEGEKALVLVEKAIGMDPENALVRLCACAINYAFGKGAEAHQQIAEAERLAGKLPFVVYWEGILALDVDHDVAAARRHRDTLLRMAPNMPLANLLDGFVLMAEEKPDLVAARTAYSKALAFSPKIRLAMLGLADTYEREGNLPVARIWLDRLLARDSRNMKGLVARARIHEKEGNNRASAEDLSAAIALDPFRADLYRQRAETYEKMDEGEKAKADREMADALETTNKTKMENK